MEHTEEDFLRLQGRFDSLNPDQIESVEIIVDAYKSFWKHVRFRKGWAAVCHLSNFSLIFSLFFSSFFLSFFLSVHSFLAFLSFPSFLSSFFFSLSLQHKKFPHFFTKLQKSFFEFVMFLIQFKKELKLDKSTEMPKNIFGKLQKKK